MPCLGIATLAATGLSVAASVLFLVALTVSDHGVSVATGVWLVLVGLLGVASGVAIIWSNLHEGRRRWVGVILALLYLGGAFLPSIILVALHIYGLAALLLLALALWNVVKWRDAERG